jgi:hypothetical protein
MAQLYGLSPTMPNDSSSLFEEFGRGFGEPHGIYQALCMLEALRLRWHRAEAPNVLGVL